MRALWIENKKLSHRTDLSPTPIDGGVEVDVSLAGICGTDLELLQGYYGFVGVPGHEFVGCIATGEQAGQRVVADINFGCGSCRFCRVGVSHHCEARRVLGIKSTTGAFAEQIIVPAKNLVSVPDHVPDWQAAQVEPLAAALRITEQIDLVGRRILLVGAGRLGRMVIRTIGALLPDADFQVCVRNPERYAAIIDADFVTPDQIKAPVYDVAIDCTGSSEGFALALAGLQPQGTLVVKSTYAGQLSLDMSRIVVDEIKVQGSRCGDIQAAMDCLASGQIRLPKNRLAYYSLEAFSDAFHEATDHMTEKVFFQI